MNRGIIFTISIAILLLTGCKEPFDESKISTSTYMHQAMQKYSDVMVYDIFSPPQASRNYAYASIAAYETLAQGDDSYVSMAGQLRELSAVPSQPIDTYSIPLAALEAFYVTAAHFIFSEDKLLSKREEALEKIKEESNISKQVYEASLKHGQAMAKHIIAWSDGDMYKQTRTFPKYTITKDPAKWKPTPPAYGLGIEPHWREIRPMVLDSAQQFVPLPPTKFNLDKGSAFYKETMEVYDVVNSVDAEKKEIASFWDCNPYALNVIGHVKHATKKITPGGHWISITKIACEKADKNLIETAEAYALTSIALFDGFISCWDEKYRSSLVRPETVINEHIDENWVPILQTPPFPEHTSGHSVVSRAAAITLTSLFGDNFSFDDDTEVQYGIPVRSFTSFLSASEEAAISRLYGGIHYRPAIEYGVEQGEEVGKLVVKRVTTKS